MKREGLEERIQRIMDYVGENKRQFAQRIGYQSQNLGAALKGQRSVSPGLLEKITKAFPEINREWLYWDNGEMVNKDILSEQAHLRPRLPVSAAAGKLGAYINGVKASDCEMMPIIKNFPSYDFTMFIQGNSMEPYFLSGDEIALSRASIIQWGKEYVLDTEEGAVFKKIYEDGDNIRCVSYNKEEYHDFLVPKTMIYGFYKVVGMIRV